MEQTTPATHAATGVGQLWTWCARCERAHISNAARVVQFAGDPLHPHPASLKLCPYFDCSASTKQYGWRWENIRLEHPSYPLTPERGVIYTR